MRKIFTVFILCACAGCGSHSEPYKTENLGQATDGSIIAETWLGTAPMEQPVWRVCLKPNGSTNLQPLFIVEAEFQESEPGYPRLISTNGVPVVQDADRSYAFSLVTRNFITNRWAGNVYLGNFKTRDQTTK